MSLQFLVLLAAWMLASITPEPLDIDRFVADSRPYLQQLAGREVSEPYVYYGGFGAGYGETDVTAGGCTTSHRINPAIRGEIYEAHTLAHELAHGYQGAACAGLVAWERDGRYWWGTASTGQRINLEISASLIGLEALAEMCRDDYPGACAWFWGGVEKIARERAGWSTESIAAYRTGPVRGLTESRGGMVSAVPGSFEMDDAWSLLGEAAWAFAQGYGAR